MHSILSNLTMPCGYLRSLSRRVMPPVTFLLVSLLWAALPGCANDNTDNDSTVTEKDNPDTTNIKTSFIAASGSNKPCQTTSDCPAPEICFEAAQQCRKTCTIDGECPGQSVCSTALGVCVTCNDHADCGTGYCHPELFGCVQCVDDTHCGGKGVCRTDTHFCVQCQKDDDCPTGHCASDQSVCVECLDHAHCNDNDPCTKDLCLPTHTCFYPLVASVDQECETNLDCAAFVTQPCHEAICVPGECGGGTCSTVKVNPCEQGCAHDADCPPKPGYCAPICVETECFYPEVHSNESCQCVVNADCPPPLPCHNTACVAGQCVETPKPDGIGCNDGEICTEKDQCVQGICQGSWVQCTAGGMCTESSCKPGVGCQNAPLSGVPCDDKNLCTSSDLCVGGLCVGGVLPCDDNNPCTVDLCAPAAGCFHQATDGTLCDDGNPCTQNDICVAKVCTGGSPTCFDGNPCTSDVCSPGKGCEYIPLDTNTLCDDNNPCTEGDICTSGVCSGTSKTCPNPSVCTASFCDVTGGCKTVPVETGTTCNDGDLCTYGDTCISGVCKGKKLVCEDANECTEDVCKPTIGCVYLATAGTVCDDGDICTTFDQCTLVGQCVGIAAACNDDNPCTTESCFPGVGCVAETMADSTVCGANDCGQSGVCMDGTCSGKSFCDDNNPCTVDLCDNNNECQYKPVPTATLCDDANPCTSSDACVNGLCKGKPVLCEDSGPCVATKCDPSKGCLKFIAPDKTVCNDSNNCTVSDVCFDGVCTGIQISCDDNNPCTKDACDFHAGCWHTHANDGIPCDDTEPCTIGDTCHSGKCQGKPLSNCKTCTKTADCADNNPCTLEKCDGAGVCLYGLANGLPCNDGLLCTAADHCTAGTCVGTQIKGCEEPLCYPLGHICSADGTDINGTCSPGYTCACVSSCADCADCPLKVCLAKSVATYPLSLCEPITGCDSEVAACQCVGDNTANDCAALVCAPKPNCECTQDTDCASKGLCGSYCDSGSCIKLDFSPECDVLMPNDSCPQTNTTCLDTGCGPKCFAFAEAKPIAPCLSDTISECDDGNPCTSDVCDPKVGCAHVVFSNGTLCDDGDVCTGPDTCEFGECGGPETLPPQQCCANVICGDTQCTPSCENDVNCPQDCTK